MNIVVTYDTLVSLYKRSCRYDEAMNVAHRLLADAAATPSQPSQPRRQRQRIRTGDIKKLMVLADAHGQAVAMHPDGTIVVSSKGRDIPEPASSQKKIVL